MRLSRESRNKHGMIESESGKSNGCGNVLFLKVGQFIDNLVGGQSGCAKIEDIGNADSHSPDAWASAALPDIDGDPLAQIGHSVLLM